MITMCENQWLSVPIHYSLDKAPIYFGCRPSKRRTYQPHDTHLTWRKKIITNRFSLSTTSCNKIIQILCKSLQMQTFSMLMTRQHFNDRKKLYCILCRRYICARWIMSHIQKSQNKIRLLSHKFWSNGSWFWHKVRACLSSSFHFNA